MQILNGRSGKAVAAVAGIAVLYKLYKTVKASQARQSLASLEQGVVHVFLFPRWTKGPNFSSPCLKLETFLRIAKIPYIAHLSMDAISLSPTERLPFISYNGELVADSEFIIQYLTKKFDVKLDSSLSPEQHAQGLQVRRQVESFVSWGMYRSLWVDNAKVMAKLIIESMGAPALLVNWILMPQFRKGTIKMLNTVGHGDLTNEQYKSEFLRDLRALELQLSKKAFLLTDDSPTSYDCAVYNYLSIISAVDMSTEAFAFVRNSRPIQEYVARMNRIAFPDMATITDTKAKVQSFRTF